MGSIAVVTTFSRKGYEVYGRRMLQSFERFWPQDIVLYVYYEGEKPDDATLRAQWVPLDADEERAAFIARHTDHPFDYRRQPVKFCHKVFAVTNAPRVTDWLIWLDGDVETTAPVTPELLASVLPAGVVASYLGRRWWAHTEAGFLAYRLDSLEPGRYFLDDLRAVYLNGCLFKLHQHHDCAAFDYMRQIYEGQGYKFHDLGENFKGPGLDVMGASLLGAVMWHNKGMKRKREAYGDVA